MSTTGYSFDVPDEHFFYALRDAIGTHWFSLEEAAMAVKNWVRERLAEDPRAVFSLNHKDYCENVRNPLASVTWGIGDNEYSRFCATGWIKVTLTWDEQRSVYTDVPNKTVVIDGVEYISTTKEPRIETLSDWVSKNGERVLYLHEFQIQGIPK